MITLLLVEDELLVRQGLRMWFDRSADIAVVGEASNGADAIMLAQILQPDVILMDISQPVNDGITTVAAIHASVLYTAIVVLSLHDDVITRAKAYAAGAVAVVGKQEGVKALQITILEAGRYRSHPHSLV